MYKTLVTLALLMPFVLAQLPISFHVDAVSGSYSIHSRNGKNRFVLMEDKYIGLHPCSFASVCECWLEQATLQLSVNCSRRSLTNLPRLYKGLRIYELDLSGNALEQTPNMTDEGYNLVQRLNLSGNRIKSIDGHLISANLEVLLLKNNQISRIPKTVLDKVKNGSSLKWLDLDKNPLTCDCKAATLVHFVRNSNIPRLLRLACTDADKQVKHLLTNEMCPGKLVDFFKQLREPSDQEIMRESGVF